VHCKRPPQCDVSASNLTFAGCDAAVEVHMALSSIFGLRTNAQSPTVTNSSTAVRDTTVNVTHGIPAEEVSRKFRDPREGAHCVTTPPGNATTFLVTNVTVGPCSVVGWDATNAPMIDATRRAFADASVQTFDGVRNEVVGAANVFPGIAEVEPTNVALQFRCPEFRPKQSTCGAAPRVATSRTQTLGAQESLTRTQVASGSTTAERSARKLRTSTIDHRSTLSSTVGVSSTLQAALLPPPLGSITSTWMATAPSSDAASSTRSLVASDRPPANAVAAPDGDPSESTVGRVRRMLRSPYVSATAPVAVAVAAIAVPTAAAQPARLAAAARIAQCAFELEEPSYLEHPFQPHVALSDAEENADVAARLNGALLCSAGLVVAAVVAAALLHRRLRSTDNQQARAAWPPHAGLAILLTVTFFVPNIAGAAGGPLFHSALTMAPILSLLAAAAGVVFLACLTAAYAGGTADATPRLWAHTFSSAVRVDDNGKAPPGAPAALPSRRQRVVDAYLLVEAATSAIVALLSGIQPGQRTRCVAVGVVGCLFAALLLGYTLVVRPYASRIDALFLTLYAVAQLGLAALATVLVATEGGSSAGVSDAAVGDAFEALVALQLTFIYVHAAAMLCAYAVEFVRRRSRPATSNDANDNLPAAVDATVAVPLLVVPTNPSSPSGTGEGAQQHPVNPLGRSV